MRIQQTKLFSYTELSDEAKERAREWLRTSDIIGDTESEMVSEDMVYFLTEEKGYILNDKHPVQWSLAYAQGDYAGFDGTVGKELLEKDLKDLLSERDWNWYNRLKDIIDITVSTEYHHYHGQQTEVEVSLYTYSNYPQIERLVDRIQAELESYYKSEIRLICKELYRRARNAFDYYYSDEYLNDELENNDHWEFTEDGMYWKG